MLLLHPSLSKAQELHPQFFNEQGFIKPKKLLSLDTNAKTIKGRKRGFATAIMYLAPSNMSGLMNVCPMASKGCRAACLFSAGRGRFQNVKQSRLHRTVYYAIDPEGFMLQLVQEIAKAKRRADKLELTLTIRLNGTSDIQWEDITVEGKTVFEHFPRLQFYDYTKIAKRMFPDSKAMQIANYHLVFSRSESNHTTAMIVLNAGGSVAMVFANRPSIYGGFRVIDGDADDLRFLDKPNSIVGLTAKGDAKLDGTGFVIR